MLNIEYKDEIFSTDLKEIINYKPHWLLRNGNFIFLFLFFAVVVSTTMVKYPEHINGSLILVHSGSTVEKEYYGHVQFFTVKSMIKKIRVDHQVRLSFDQDGLKKTGQLNGMIQSITKKGVDSLAIDITLNPSPDIKYIRNAKTDVLPAQLILNTESVFNHIRKSLGIFGISR